MLKKKILLLLTCIMLGGLIIINLPISNYLITCCDDSQIDSILEDKYGDDYYSIYNYDETDLGIFKIIHVNRDCEASFPKFSGDSYSKVSQAIDYMNEFPYHADQEDPNLVAKQGGNCVALSIYFECLCEYNDIDCSIISDGDSHVYNRVKLDNVNYLVDLSDKTFREES